MYCTIMRLICKYVNVSGLAKVQSWRTGVVKNTSLPCARACVLARDLLHIGTLCISSSLYHFLPYEYGMWHRDKKGGGGRGEEGRRRGGGRLSCLSVYIPVSSK